MTTDPDILEAATRAVHHTHSPMPDRIAEAVLAAVTPLIEAAALEEAAKVVEEQPYFPANIGARQYWVKDQIAAAIRALRDQS